MLILPEWLRWSLEWSVIGLPLGVYLTVLGSWQYHLRHPVLVRGSRDLLGLFLGLSGFFLLGPPSWLVHRLRGQGDAWYGTGYAIYVVALILLSRWLVRRRQNVTVIYAIHAEDAEAALDDLLKHLAAPYQLVPGRICWPEHDAVVDIRIAPLLHTVTLHWLRAPASWRQHVEERLSQFLVDKPPQRALTPLWLLLGAVLIGLGVFHLLVWSLLTFLRA
ncbi:MAG: hypothetical protein NZ914_06215 [Gemmatales bacterium]|nr:hypothetical protein [Gemmatales bacterium]